MHRDPEVHDQPGRRRVRDEMDRHARDRDRARRGASRTSTRSTVRFTDLHAWVCALPGSPTTRSAAARRSSRRSRWPGSTKRDVSDRARAVAPKRAASLLRRQANRFSARVEPAVVERVGRLRAHHRLGAVGDRDVRGGEHRQVVRAVAERHARARRRRHGGRASPRRCARLALGVDDRRRRCGRSAGRRRFPACSTRSRRARGAPAAGR